MQLPAEGWRQVQLAGKGQRVRWVPANEAARRALEAYLAERHDDHPALFLNLSRERFSVRGVALLLNRQLQRIGVTDRSGPHLLRHTFATHSCGRDRTCGRCRSCSATPALRPPSGTPTRTRTTCASRWPSCRAAARYGRSLVPAVHAGSSTWLAVGRYHAVTGPDHLPAKLGGPHP